MSAMTRKQAIVVVDDDTEIQDLVIAYFAPKGFDVICFGNAEAAIKESLVSGRDWDVLLTDFHFPNISGVDFTIQIKKTLPNLPVILITPPESADIAVDAIKKGAYDFIVKPIHFPQLQIAVDRALRLNDLTGDISELRERVKLAATNHNKMVGRSPKFLQALDIAKRVATSHSNILLSGESGTGKEVFTRFIHNESKNRKGPFVAINCSSIPEHLLESELFGHAKGSFTGAHVKKDGLFEEAEDGTLFLDEIGDLSLPLQAKLLRVIQERKIKRVGENQYRPINCRIISATHKDLQIEVNEKRFREDLFFRLNVIPITLPPLRERVEDILPLAETFLRKFALINASPAVAFSTDAIKFILENPWRGNVRELENSIERAVVLSDGAEIGLDAFVALNVEVDPLASSEPRHSRNHVFSVQFVGNLPTLDEVIQKYVEFAVSLNAGARDKTAKDLKIDRKTLYKRLKPSATPSLT